MRHPFSMKATLLWVCLVATSVPASDATKVPFEVVPQPYTGKIDQCQDRVIRDRVEWEQLWTSQFPEHSVPEVDFQNEMVILTAMGFTVSHGASIHVTGVTARRVSNRSNPLLIVSIRELRGKKPVSVQGVVWPLSHRSLSTTTSKSRFDGVASTNPVPEQLARR